VNRSFNLSPSWYIVALQYMKSRALGMLSGQAANEAAIYFDCSCSYTFAQKKR
jgi:phycocyanin alpha chain